MVNGVWQEALTVLDKQLNKDIMEHWFYSVIDTKQDNNIFYLRVHNENQKEWMEAAYSYIIKDALFAVTGLNLDLEFVLPEPPKEVFAKTTPESFIGTSSFTKSPSPFNSSYTFENFVVGNSNRFAHAAALAVADKPGSSYNPFFIYGGSGLGKTHLVRAIGQRILEMRPKANVLYISTETFLNEFVYSLRQGDAAQFKNRYRTVDVFLVDDIQFIAGKEGVQEEFFHTFNALHSKNKQIVISSDRPPKDIATLEERLRSRFEWGLITDIQPPDTETRIAILQHKAARENIIIKDEALYYIANKITYNIRQLEGALNRVRYFANFNNHDVIDLEVAEIALEGILSEQKQTQLSIDIIKQAVSDYFNISIKEMNSDKRDRMVSWPRQIAMYLCRDLLEVPQARIGQEFYRDHTTVIHACEKVKIQMETDGQLRQNIEYIIKQLRSPKAIS